MKWEWTLSHRNTVYRRRVEDNILHSTFTQCYVYVQLFPCTLAWSVFVWYAIKIDMRPGPVSIFSDYSTIKENSLRHVKKADWKMTTSDVKTEFTFMRVLYKIVELFYRTPQNSLFSVQQFSFPIHSQVTSNTDKHVKELLMERFCMVTPQDFAKQFQKWEFPNIPL